MSGQVEREVAIGGTARAAHGPPGDRLLGPRILAASLQLPGHRGRLAPLLLETAKRSPTPTVRLGRTRATLLTSPADVAHVLVSGTDNYEKPHRVTGAGMREIAGMGVLTAKAAEARPGRRLLAPELRIDAISPYAELTRRLAGEQVNTWLRRGKLDLFRDLVGLVRRISLATIVGERWRATAPNLELELLRRHGRKTAARSGLLDPPGWIRSDAKLDAEVERLVLAARRGAGGDSVLAGLVAESSDDPAITKHVLTILLASFDNGGATTAWTLLELAQNKRDLDAVRAESGGSDGFFERTGRAVDETLRLHPPVFRTHRTALGRERLPSGASLPAGRTVIISPYVLGRLPELWDDPEGFNPSRFDPSNAKHNKYAYIPFGAGHRVCVARTLALMQIRALVSEIASGLDLEPLVGLAPERVLRVPRYSCPAEALPAR